MFSASACTSIASRIWDNNLDNIDRHHSGRLDASQPIVAAGSVPACIAEWARRQPQAPAILAPGRADLSYGELWQQVRYVAGALASIGLGRGDRIGISLPPGPEQASAIVAVVSCATAVVLDPEARQEEMITHLQATRAKALIATAGTQDKAIYAAVSLGIPYLELSASYTEPAGVFLLKHDGRRLSGHQEPATSPADIAYVMRTSGTTGGPKFFVCTHRNLCQTNFERIQHEALTPRDRAVAVVPMYVSYGLKLTLFMPLLSGGTLACPPAFDEALFFDWVAEFRPTWYAAPPIVHRTIAERVADHPGILAGWQPRFIHTSGAAVGADLHKEIVAALNAPLVVLYAISEACNVTATPMPPADPRPGSVGKPFGPPVMIVDSDGHPVGQGLVGEVLVRPDERVCYENSDETSAVDAWFHTGDLGFFDADGYLFLTGRLKEVINRGGQKVSPVEVEDVLTAHPDVQDVAVFGLPHPTLGEEVAAAVVLSPGSTAAVDALKDFAAKGLSPFQVPRLICFVESLPRSANGKVQRNQLAGALGLTASPSEYGPSELQSTPVSGLSQPQAALSALPPSLRLAGPRDVTEDRLLRLWQDAFGRRGLGVSEDFFDLGGHSLLAARLVAAVEQEFGVRLAPSVVLYASTVEAMARLVRDGDAPGDVSCLVELQAGGSQPPFFWVHGAGGDVLCLRNLARYMGGDRPQYGIRAAGLNGPEAFHQTVEGMAAQYIGTVRAVQPAGPYHLGGLSAGGLVAYEMAQQLQRSGDRAAVVVLLDTPNLARRQWPSPDAWRAYNLRMRLEYHTGNLLHLAPSVRLRYVLERGGLLGRRTAARLVGAMRRLGPGRVTSVSPLIKELEKANIAAANAYVPQMYPGRVVLFRARERMPGYEDDPLLGWEGLATGGLEVHEVPGYHASMIAEPYIRILASELRTCLATPGDDDAIPADQVPRDG